MHYQWGQTAAKKKRGHFKHRTSSKKSSATLTVVDWNVITAVYIASNCLSSEHKRFVQRWNKVERKYMQVQQPNQFLCYKQTMEFVGRMDQNVAKYKIGIPMKKWRRALFPWMFDIILQNVWVFYRIKDQDDESLSLLSFRRHVVNAIFVKFKGRQIILM